MTHPTFDFLVHDERLAIARLDPHAAVPSWALGRFVTVSRTAAELSVVCAQRHVPPGVRQERDRVALGIAGVVEMTTIGVLASICRTLADAQVPVFVISTYETDWLLVRADRFGAAHGALVGAGHRIRGPLPY
ncbi:MAG: ACT domain-containing protein [Planctomycetes bacterium]|nr:ACT domain-containing protein [Planctomycetota bacterium]